MQQPLLVGVCGGTGSGKTTVAQAISEALGHKCVILPQDAYYKDNRDLPFGERIKLNYDHPDAFDNDLMEEHLRLIKQGHPVEMPVYSFETYTRTDETRLIQPAPVVLVEGILIFENKRIRDLLDIKIFVDTDADVRIIRRTLRDVKERGRTLDSVFNQYLNSVKPMHEAFVEPSKRYADIILPEGGFNQVGLDILISKIKMAVSARS